MFWINVDFKKKVLSKIVITTTKSKNEELLKKIEKLEK